jgi:hypothetical protein
MLKFSEDHKNEYTGKAVGIAAALLGWATRNNAGEYLVHDMLVYKTELLAEAKESLKADSAAYKEYEEYIDTLLLNVIMESTMSDAGANGSDLTLTIAQAKRYLRTLRETRGDPPTNFIEKNADLRQKFSLGDVTSESPDLEKVLSDPTAYWRLSGETIPPDVPGVSSGGSVARTAQAPSVVTHIITDADIDRLKQGAEMTKPSDQEKVLEGIRGAGARAPELRDKFDKTGIDNLTYPTDKDQIHNALLGRTNPKPVEDTILDGIHSANDLDPLLSLQNQTTDGEEHTRIQHALDRGAVHAMQDASSVIERLRGLTPEKIQANTPEVKQIQKELVKLYSSVSDKNALLLPDTVSLGLECLLLGGDYSKGIDDYNQKLQGLGLNPVSVEKPKRPWIEWTGSLFAGKDNLASERFAEKQKLGQTIILNKMKTRLNTIKTELAK